MTAIGGNLLLYAGVPLLLIFFSFSPLRSIQFICLFLLLLILGSKAYSVSLAGKLLILRRDNELRVFRHEWAEIELWVENKGRLPAFLLMAEDFSAGIAVFRDRKCLFNIGGKNRQLFRWKAYGSNRGVFTLGPASIRGSDPLGIFPFTITAAETARLFVYPATAHVDLGSSGGLPLGNLITRNTFYEDLTRPRSLRDYSPGDESKRINWKASAKNFNLLVNEYEPSLSYPVVVFLNADIREYAIKKRESHIERAIEAVAAVCLMAARERQALGLIIHLQAALDNSSVISPASFTLIPILERLAALDPYSGKEAITENRQPPEHDAALPEPEIDNQYFHTSTLVLLGKAKTLPFGTRLIYVGPAPAEEDYNALELMQKRHLSLEYLIIGENKAIQNPGANFLRHKVSVHQVREWGYGIL